MPLRHNKFTSTSTEVLQGDYFRFINDNNTCTIFDSEISFHDEGKIDSNRKYRCYCDEHFRFHFSNGEKIVHIQLGSQYELLYLYIHKFEKAKARHGLNMNSTVSQASQVNCSVNNKYSKLIGMFDGNFIRHFYLTFGMSPSILHEFMISTIHSLSCACGMFEVFGGQTSSL